MRTVKLAAIAVALALVPLSVALVLSAKQRDERAAIDRAAQSAVAQLRSTLTAFSAQASGASRLEAHNPAFNAFLAHPSLRTRADAEAALATLGDVYPGSLVHAQLVAWQPLCSVATACGRALIVYTPAGGAGSGGEVSDPWFARTTHLDPGEVLQSAPFQDGGTWVVGFSTVVESQAGVPAAVVQLELPVEALRQSAARIARGAQTKGLELAVVDGSGKVVVDDRRPQLDGAALGHPLDKRFAALTAEKAVTGAASLGGKRVAWTKLPTGDTNLNRWTVAALAPAGGGFLGGALLPGALVVLALLLLAFALSRRISEESGAPPVMDALTGLGNRRKLEADLARMIPQATETEPLVLALLDLEGFKTYNDSYGRTAGDALLARLGKNLAHAVEGRGAAYRMGGDEFCVVASVGADGPARVLADAEAALSERGEGFAIASTYGAVLLPKEATDAAAALRIADQRLYAGKATDSRSAGRQSADVLLQALHERSPELGSHLHDVAMLAREVGQRLGMNGEELDEIAQAAELHDVGKMAIPDAILKKPGPLDHEEWEFIRGHTIIGERIVSAAPALVSVAKLIRSSHERFNGTGYPDALKGEEIPLGARVVAVCDAYDAMIGPRPYRLGLSKEDAISELRRCASAQFDPVVVDVFCSVVDSLEVDDDDEDPAVIASRHH